MADETDLHPDPVEHDPRGLSAPQPADVDRAPGEASAGRSGGGGPLADPELDRPDDRYRPPADP